MINQWDMQNAYPFFEWMVDYGNCKSNLQSL